MPPPAAKLTQILDLALVVTFTLIPRSSRREFVTYTQHIHCLKKRHPFYICHNFVRCHPIYPVLGRNIPHEIWNKHKCTENHISFRVFVLYRVKLATISTVYSRPTASNTKSTHKSQNVTSDDYQVTFILSQQVFEVSSISSHTGAQPSTPRGQLPRRWHTDADQNRSCINQASLKFAFWQKIYTNFMFLAVIS